MQPTMAVIVAAACGLAACDSSIRIVGSAPDGETFTGVATQTGGWDISGTLQVVSNRGRHCVGTFDFVGYGGPKGHADLDCSDGSKAVAELDRTARTGVGTIGEKPFRFTW